MAGGRPTKYDEEVIELAKMYIEDYGSYDQVVPTIVGLCRVINRSKSTVYKWAKEEGKEEFSDILSQIEELQEDRLVAGGLRGDFNSAITKMLLTKHGYTDKTEVKQDTDLTVEIVSYQETDQ